MCGTPCLSKHELHRQGNHLCSHAVLRTAAHMGLGATSNVWSAGDSCYNRVIRHQQRPSSCPVALPDQLPCQPGPSLPTRMGVASPGQSPHPSAPPAPTVARQIQGILRQVSSTQPRSRGQPMTGSPFSATEALCCWAAAQGSSVLAWAAPVP